MFMEENYELMLMMQPDFQPLPAPQTTAEQLLRGMFIESCAQIAYENMLDERDKSSRKRLNAALKKKQTCFQYFSSGEAGK